MWPVYVTILNLPPSIQMKAENIMLAGVWVGPHKPSMKLLLEPIIDDLKYLYTDGLTVMLPNGHADFKAKLAMAVFDLPAKASVLNCKQFNGKFGCCVCYHPGLWLSTWARIYHPGLWLSTWARIYPPLVYQERTHAEVLSAAKEAEAKHCTVKGILGVSHLSTLLDVVDAVPVDYMHCCLEGVMRSLKLIFPWKFILSRTLPFRN